MPLGHIKYLIITIFMVLPILLSANAQTQEQRKTIILESQNGDRKLIYYCDNFRHQAKQGEDLRVLMRYLSTTMTGLVKNNDVITAHALETAFDKNDVRRIEKIIVEYRCGL